MNSLKKMLTIPYIAMLCSCSTSHTNDIEPHKDIPTTLQSECVQSGSEESPQCHLYHSDLHQDEKQSQLGLMYFSGYGTVPKDCEKSKYWLLKSAEAKNSDSLNQLGVFYYTGCRTTEQLNNDLTVQTFELDYKTAEEYFLLAIEAGDKNAKANLAGLYARGGYGVEKNHDKAIPLFKEAIEDSPARAYDGLGVLYLEQKKYSKALPYIKKGAEAGSSQAQYNLAYFYENGFGGLEVDNEKAIEWYTKSVEQGYPLAQNNLRILKEKIGK